MLYELKKQKNSSENELKLMAAKLYKAKQEGVSLSFYFYIFPTFIIFFTSLTKIHKYFRNLKTKKCQNKKKLTKSKYLMKIQVLKRPLILMHMRV